MGIFGIVFGTLLTYGFVVAVFNSKTPAPPLSQLHVKSLIERANAFEYNLYGQVGRQDVDTSGLYLFFTKDGPAWQTIEGIIKRSQDISYILNLEKSRWTLVSIEIIEVKDSTVILKSG